MHVQAVGRQEELTLVCPLDPHDPPAVQVVRQADIHQLMLRFKTIEIGMRQWLAPLIFVDKHERWTTDGTCWNTQPFSNTANQRRLARAQFAKQRQDLSPSQGLADLTP